MIRLHGEDAVHVGCSGCARALLLGSSRVPANIVASGWTAVGDTHLCPVCRAAHDTGAAAPETRDP